MVPPVELSTTLADLYSLDGGRSDDVALVYAFPHSSALSSSLPVSTKYAYQSPRTVKLSGYTMSRFCLGCMAQYYGFIAGQMDLHLFDLDRKVLELASDWMSWREPTHRTDATRVFEGLARSQRPRVHFVSEPAQVTAQPQKKAVITPMDWISDKQSLVHPDAHWDLLSKRSLALSCLPSPSTEVIDSILRPSEAQDTKAVTSEINRMLAPIEQRPLPIVVKLPLGLGGHAVFMVRDEEQRRCCTDILRSEMPAMFAAQSPEMSQPFSLLVQEIVPGQSAGLSLFITRTGRPVYISCSEQILDDRDYWSGGYMDYRRQDELREQFEELTHQIAAYVRERGYYGPMGVDVMTDETGRQLIVDMNIRQTGSYTLGLMKKHFWEKRGKPFGGLVCPLAIRGDRDHFEQRFAKEIEDGTMVIASWSRGWAGPGGLFLYSVCGLMVGTETREDLQALMDRLYDIQLKK